MATPKAYDPSEAADSLEHQVQGLRALATDEVLPNISAELTTLGERAAKVRDRAARAATEAAEIRDQERALRKKRAVRVHELAEMGAPVSALATHASMSVALVRTILDDKTKGDEGGVVDEVVEEVNEPEQADAVDEYRGFRSF